MVEVFGTGLTTIAINCQSKTKLFLEGEEQGSIGSTSIYLEIKNLEIFKSLIDEGLAKLKSLGVE